MIDVDIKFRGFEDAAFLLDTLPRKIQKRVVKQSLRRGAVVIQKRAKSLAPFRSGTLRKSIKVRTGRSLKAQVFAEGGKKTKNDGWYAHILERGSKPFTAGGKFAGARNPGIKGRGFFERAAESTTGETIAAIAKRFETLILKELAK